MGGHQSIPPTRIAYLRVSTEEQASSGLGLGAQRRAIEREASARGWTDVEWIADEAQSAKDLSRPGIQKALAALEQGHASTLVVAKLDRLSRSLLDFATLLAKSQEEGWELISLDLGVDTTTPTGRFVANLMANVAQLERELIGQRTREALAIRRRQGVVLGRPSVVPQAVRDAILEKRATGYSYEAIARYLNEVGIPTAHGGRQWYRATVRQVALSSAGLT